MSGLEVMVFMVVTALMMILVLFIMIEVMMPMVIMIMVVTATCQSSKHGRKEGLGGQGLGEHSILPEEHSRMKAMTLIEDYGQSVKNIVVFYLGVIVMRATTRKMKVMKIFGPPGPKTW